MLSFNRVSVYLGARQILKDVSFVIHAGQKVGLTGANGAGKSTLLALAAGHLSADAGDISRSGGQVVAEVAQDIVATRRTVRDYVLDGDQRLRQLQSELDQAQKLDQGERIGALYAEFEAISGFTAEARAARILSGLGVADSDQQRSLLELSGGLRRRAVLARALMCPSNLLLLDEPTNHLDLDAVIWLEGWLQRYSGTLLLVAHDRDFLDQVAGAILNLEHGAGQLYSGNYSAFEVQRSEMLAHQQATYVRQQRTREHMQKFVERFRYKATKARQAQSRLKALERMPNIALAHVDSPFKFTLPEPARLPNPLLDIENVSIAYDTTPVLSEVQLRLQPGQRIGVLGRNGAGKSTLVQMLAGALPVNTGRYQAAPDVSIGYFAQHQLEQLHADDNAYIHLARLAPELGEKQLRTLLGGFGFSGDQAFTPVEHLSGGERARLALALVLQLKPNLLLLDEPTNHLDLEMRHALTLALQEFKGALLVVSHDRHLLRNVVDELWLVTAGGVGPYEGDLDDYVRWLKQNRREAREAPPASAQVEVSKPDTKRKLSNKEQRELAALPDQVESLEAEQLSLQSRLSDPEFYKSAAPDETADLNLRLNQIERDLQQRYDRWSELDA